MTAETKRRHIAAALAAGAAALTVMWTPVGLIETVVSSSGISEILPAAAPPLGTTARVLMALFAAMMAWGAGWMIGRERSQAEETAGNEMTGEEINDQGGQDMGFALSKLTALAARRRGPANDREKDLPVLRRADAHPDAPVRQPIFASRDLGGESLFARPLHIVEEERGPIEDAAGLSLPAAPEPMEEAALFEGMPETGHGEDHIPSIAPGGQWQEEAELAGPSFAFAPLDAQEDAGPRFTLDAPVAHDDHVGEEAVVGEAAAMTDEAGEEVPFVEPVAAIEPIEEIGRAHV